MKINKNEEVLKRLLIDIFGSLTCIIIFSPIFIMAPILIKLDSKGPIFFKQKRIGRNGKYFVLYKFRSMVLNVDEISKRNYFIEELSELIFQKKEDHRTTRVGKILRRGFDELPQLFNVLKGDMSLVGPRPEIPEIAKLYNKREKLRLQVNPGITGLAIIKGRGDISLKDTINYDLEYIKNWSLWLDIKILFKTLYVVLITGRGAR